jgi:hydroxyacylglutathione hydrolase
MELIALPAFSDNYIWMLHDGARALVVDPGDAAVVEQTLDARQLELAAILVTHHHADHVGGVDALRARLHGPIFGPARETIPKPYTAINGGDSVEALGLRFEVFDVPGHTAGHIAYLHRPEQPPGRPKVASSPLGGRSTHSDDIGGQMHGEAPLLFCGDTLFSAGCGRLFEGTPAQMHASLSRLAALPGRTRVCCTHEYTLSNLRFAHAVEPGNRNIASYTAWCEAERAQGLPTLPSTIEREKQINPFLRCQEQAVAASAGAHGAASDDPVAVFAALREWKNQF